MSANKKSYARKIRKNLKKEGVIIDPLLDGLLEELERLENIRESLYDVYTTSDIIEEYTNKGGATNLVINAAVKEYKMYSQRFNEVSKTIENMLKTRVPEKPQDDDPLDEINRRERA